MISPFTNPVLVIAADAVRELEGRDALTHLWTLLTKCKGGLQDGRRLENISWRLWYRDMVASQPYRPPTPESSSSTYSETREEFPFFTSVGAKSMHKNESSRQSLKLVHEWHESPVFAASCHQSDHSSAEKPSMPLGLISPLSSNHGRDKASPSVGTFIVNMLSHSQIAPAQSPSAGQHSNSCRDSIHPVILPTVSLPTVCLPPPTPVSADSVFPRVVVVNPTPHPTPPATPVLRNITSPAQLPSAHLLPPLPSSTLMSQVSSTERDTPLPEAQLLPPPGWISKAAAIADKTLKASDRRFFLEHSVQGESPERDESTDGGKATLSDNIEGSSGGSSQMQSKGSAESNRSPVMKSSTRKGKEVLRHVGMVRTTGRRQMTRPSTKRQVSADGCKPRPTFNIGSSSSNGSKGAQNGNVPSSSKVNPPPLLPKAPPSPVKAASTQGRRIVVASSLSSEYETDSDDDSWCSEEMSAEESEKKKEEIRLREAALEAQRQRDMFAKVPKRSYSNLDRSKSGLLSTLLNPDPNIFPPNHPYRTSHSSHDVTQLPRRPLHLGFTPMQPLTTSKSSAAIPQASQATAHVSSTNGMNHRTKTNVDGGYQPKGRPQGQEMEDDSDSDEENPDDKIQMSRSVAQERLAALAGRRGIDRSQPSRPPDSARARPILPTVTSAPIPFGHPYNLPAPAPPMTPRTTRRQMLSTELSESLRRNLLWERQVSKNVMVGPRRQSATILSNGLRPLTSTNPDESSTNDGSNAISSTSHEGRDGRDRDDRRRRAMARNRSWADDYHYSGW